MGKPAASKSTFWPALKLGLGIGGALSVAFGVMLAIDRDWVGVLFFACVSLAVGLLLALFFWAIWANYERKRFSVNSLGIRHGTRRSPRFIPMADIVRLNVTNDGLAVLRRSGKTTLIATGPVSDTELRAGLRLVRQAVPPPAGPLRVRRRRWMHLFALLFTFGTGAFFFVVALRDGFGLAGFLVVTACVLMGWGQLGSMLLTHLSIDDQAIRHRAGIFSAAQVIQWREFRAMAFDYNLGGYYAGIELRGPSGSAKLGNLTNLNQADVAEVARRIEVHLRQTVTKNFTDDGIVL